MLIIFDKDRINNQIKSEFRKSRHILSARESRGRLWKRSLLRDVNHRDELVFYVGATLRPIHAMDNSINNGEC